jgi:hypothetical protein
MNYKRTNEREIEIVPEETPIDKILETTARVSYESAKPPGSDFLELLDKQSKEIDFSEFVHLNSSEVLNIDYVNERQCKTKVRRTNDGRFVFDARLYEMNRGSPELFLDKVISKLERNVEGSEISDRSDKPGPWDRKRPKRSWFRLLLELLIELFT